MARLTLFFLNRWAWRFLCGTTLRLALGVAFRIAAFAVVLAFVVPDFVDAQEPDSSSASATSRAVGAKTGRSSEARPVIGFPFLRYEEDWTFLSDRSLRIELWDRLKYLPLNESGTVYVSLGGESRQVYEWYHNQYWGAGPQDDNGWLTQRYMAHADMHLGSRLRVFGQLQAALENGRSGGPRTYDRNKLDLHEAFFDYKQPLGERSLTFRLGRQEMTYGSGRLVESREGLNTRVSFDGVKLLGSYGKLHIDGFAVRPTLQRMGYFDDAPDSKRIFWGIYATQPILKKTSLDLYYFGLDSKLAVFDLGSGHAVRQTVGGRWSGKSGAMDFDDEAIGQFGSFADGRIRAWAIAVEHGFTFRNVRNEPRIGIRSDIASGDNNPKDNRLGTFSPLFAKGKYFGEADLNGPSNTMDLQPAITVHAIKEATVTASYSTFWRESIHDGLYGFATNLEKTGQVSGARFTGQQAEVGVDYSVNPHLVVRGVYQHFFAGDFLRQTPPGRNVNYVTAWFDYHF